MKKRACVDAYINKIKPIIRKTGFSQLRMDDISKYMDISKATLYKYFSSKDDIIQIVVEDYVNYLLEVDANNQNDTLSFAERFQEMFIYSLKCVTSISNVFLEDLKESYPDLWGKLVLAQQNRNQSLQAFFASGTRQGVFNQINADLFMVQDDIVLRHIMDYSFCIQYDITLKQALMDFYQLKKFQLFHATYLDTVDDSIIEKEIVLILQNRS